MLSLGSVALINIDMLAAFVNKVYFVLHCRFWEGDNNWLAGAASMSQKSGAVLELLPHSCRLAIKTVPPV